MNIHSTSSVVQNPEPLCLLAEDNNDVSVTNYLMQDHQVDGLRFLFKQFNKKAPGVIVNFPVSCGKSATVAIFLNAVSNVLKNPILILCNDDGGIQYWKEILVQWSSYVEDDIALEASNPFVKGKKVFLKKRENLYSYMRRQWSIIIIKENVINKDIFKLRFEADFKIFITATDIKKDMSLLTAVFNWLYPQKVINFNDFVAKENRPKEKFRKSVQLDFLLEDVAIRRYVNLKPFQTNEKADSLKEIETDVTEMAKNVTEVEYHQTDQVFKVKRSKQVNNEEANEISGQAFILIHDQVKNKTSNQNYNSYSLLINDQLQDNTSDQDIILINDDDDILNKKISQKHTLHDSSYQNAILLDGQTLNETSNQNVIFINDNQILTQTADHNVIFSTKLSDKHTLYDLTNQNLNLIDEQFVNKTEPNVIFVKNQVLNETSNQNVIFINNDQILNQTLNENIIFRNDHILNKISHNGTLKKSLNESLILIEEPIIRKTDQNFILINDHDVVHKTSSQNNFVINDDHILNQTSDENVIFANHQLVNETLDKNVICINDNILNSISNEKLFLMIDNTRVHESFTQNRISLDKKMLNKTSNVHHQKLKKNSDQIVVLPNDYNKVNVTLDENVIIIDDDDENGTNNNNYVNDVQNPISVDNPPIINENNDVDRVNIHNVSIDSKNNKLHKINSCKSTTNNKSKKFETSGGVYVSRKLDVDSFIFERKPINRDNKPSSLYYKAESKFSRFSESLRRENDFKIDLNEIKNLDDKDLLKEQLMASLHINNSINDLNKIKQKEESLIKEEPTETLNFENNSKVDVNKIKDLRNQLLESLGFDRDGKVSVNEIKNSENKNSSNVDPNKINDLSNKYLLQKQLFESLGFNSDCQEIQKSVKKNNIELNESKDIDDTLIKEESIELVSFGTKSMDNKDIENLDTNLIKEESTETLSFGTKSKDNKDIENLDTNLIKEESTETLSFGCKSKDNKDMENLDTNLIKEESTEILSFGSKSKVNKDMEYLDTNLIKEESIKTLSFGSKSKLDENDIQELDKSLIKEESPESLNFGNSSKVELNEMKDLRNRNMLQKQLIESLGLDNVKNEIKDDIKEETTEETSSVDENVHNVVVSNKRKSDVTEKNLDFKILDLEEKALKKFKGSILDSLF